MLKGLIKKWTEPAHKLQIFPASAASDENFGISSNRYATFTARQRFSELSKYLKKTVALKIASESAVKTSIVVFQKSNKRTSTDSVI